MRGKIAAAPAAIFPRVLSKNVRSVSLYRLLKIRRFVNWEKLQSLFGKVFLGYHFGSFYKSALL